MSELRFVVVVSGLVGACGAQETGVGTVTVEVDGEEASRTGWPVTGGGAAIGFVDGWSLSFDHVVVSIADFTLAGSDGSDARVSADPIVADLHDGIATAWTFEGVEARRWDRVSYRLVPVTSGARDVSGVDPAILASMEAAGASMYLSGTATRDAMTRSFAWTLGVRLHATGCHDGADDTDGLVVRSGGITEAQITVHLDHLFFDTYATDEAAMRFEPVAAVAEDDGTIPFGALATQELADLRDTAGEPLRDELGGLLAYDPGPLPIAEPNLREYVLAAALTTPHFNGEGHCDYAAE